MRQRSFIFSYGQQIDPIWLTEFFIFSPVIWNVTFILYEIHIYMGLLLFFVLFHWFICLSLQLNQTFEHTVAPPYPQFCFPRFQLPAVNCGLKILNKKIPKMNNSLSFQLHVVPSSMMKSVFLHPSQEVNHPFVRYIPPTQRSLSSQLHYQVNHVGIAVFVFK